MIKTKIINKLTKIAKKNSYQPILTNLLIQDGSIMTTDLDNEYSLTGIDKSIKGLVKLERDLISNNIVLTDQAIIDGNNRIAISQDELNEFPRIEQDFSGNSLIDIDLEVIECALNFACAYDINNILGGVNFEVKNNVLQIASTDGNIMYYYDTSLNQDHKDFSITIPVKSLKDFISLISNKKEKVFICIDKNQKYLGLSCGDVNAVLRGLEGTYPRVNQFLDTKIVNTLNTDFKHFKKANENIIKLANEITYRAHFKGDKLIADYGSIDINCNGNTDIDIHYSSKLMKCVLTGLSKFKNKNLEINLTGSTSPIYVKSGHGTGTALLMPIKHNN